MGPMAMLYLYLYLFGLLTTIYPTVHGLSSFCPVGFPKIGSACYQINYGRKTWDEAVRDCHSKDASLAYIPNLADNDAIFKLLVEDTHYWIGLNDKRTEGQFVWESGQSGNFTNWKDDEPDNWNGNQDCTQFYYPYAARWNDVACTGNTSWICSAPLSVFPEARGVWPFDSKHEGTDISGNNNHAYLHSVTYPEGPRGGPGKSMEFGGDAASYGTIPNDGGLDVKYDMTWMSWVMHLDAKDGPLFAYTPRTSSYSVHIWVSLGNKHQFRPAYRRRYDPIKWYPEYARTAAIDNFFTPRAWIHVASVFDSFNGRATVYRNGRIVRDYNTTFKGEGLDTQGDVFLARKLNLPPATCGCLKARMSCMQLYDKALTGDQIQNAMNRCNMYEVSDQQEAPTHECESEPCQNGADCLALMNGYHCLCKSGFSGKNCSEVTPTDPPPSHTCDSRPCENGGVCLALLNGYICECPPRFTGKNCTEVRVTRPLPPPHVCESQPCQNEGRCLGLVNGYYCECDGGYTGKNCTDITVRETPAPNVCESKPCQNGGSCLALLHGYYCVCTSGYIGGNCTEVSVTEPPPPPSVCESKPCQNGGNCLALMDGYYCVCESGFTGENCTDVRATKPPPPDECESKPCQNGGSCLSFPNGYHCLCDAGYTGKLCDTEVPSPTIPSPHICKSKPCQNGATCLALVDGYFCLCSDRFTGIHCEHEKHECTFDPCQNGGTCLHLVNGFHCLCRPGFTGKRCNGKDVGVTYGPSRPTTRPALSVLAQKSVGNPTSPTDSSGSGVVIAFSISILVLLVVTLALGGFCMRKRLRQRRYSQQTPSMAVHYNNPMSTTRGDVTWPSSHDSQLQGSGDRTVLTAVESEAASQQKYLD